MADHYGVTRNCLLRTVIRLYLRSVAAEELRECQRAERSGEGAGR